MSTWVRLFLFAVFSNLVWWCLCVDFFLIKKKGKKCIWLCSLTVTYVQYYNSSSSNNLCKNAGEKKNRVQLKYSFLIRIKRNVSNKIIYKIQGEMERLRNDRVLFSSSNSIDLCWFWIDLLPHYEWTHTRVVYFIMTLPEWLKTKKQLSLWFYCHRFHRYHSQWRFTFVIFFRHWLQKSQNCVRKEWNLLNTNKFYHSTDVHHQQRRQQRWRHQHQPIIFILL